jgi:hypothetical protein
MPPRRIPQAFSLGLGALAAAILVSGDFSCAVAGFWATTGTPGKKGPTQTTANPSLHIKVLQIRFLIACISLWSELE